MSFRKILLIKPNGKRGLGFASDLIPIGLEYIAASIEHVVEEVYIIDMELEQHPLTYFLNLFHPDLVGITMSATDHYEGLRLAKIAKKYDATTVLGGYHPTPVPNELLSHPQIDIVVRGEGEYTMRELVQEGCPENILGVSYKKDGRIIHNEDRPPIEDLDSLPFPARHLRRHKYNDHINKNGREKAIICISRGCWGRCSFCCEPYMSKSHQRFRSPENVMEELLEIVSFHDAKPLTVSVVDPNFMGDPKRIDRLCDLLSKQELGLRFSVMTRVDSVAKHPKLVKKMCDNGILEYELGIESPNLKDLKNTRKGITLEMQEKAVKILRENDANVSGTFVIGLLGQTEEEIKQFPVYAKKIGLMNAAFGIATPFPGTQFYNDLEKRGLIFERDWTKYDEMHSVFKSNGISSKRLEELQIYCMARFWTLKTLLDNVQVLQKMSQEKMSIKNFTEKVINIVQFAKNAGDDVRQGELGDHLDVILEAVLDAETEEKVRKIDVHSVIEMSRFLGILGSQIVQITFKCKEHAPVSYVIETTSDGTVKNIKTISGKQQDATISIDIDLNSAMKSFNDNPSFYSIGTSIFHTKSTLNLKDAWNKFRLLTAISVALAITPLYEKLKNRMG